MNRSLKSFIFGCLCSWAIASVSHLYAQGILYYPSTDGSVRGLDVVSGAEVDVILANAFVGANPGAGRNIAFDPVTRLLWYSNTDGQIFSFHIDTLAEGPDVSGVPGANPGAGRHIFIDYFRRELIVPLTDNSVAFYTLANPTLTRTIPSNFFTDGIIGAFRHFASDIRTGNLWYAATDGSFREMDPDTNTHTGREIPFSEQTGANPGAFRHFVVDPVRDLLLYVTTDGSIASINLTSLTADTFEVSGGHFVGANPGAGRTITYDITYTPIPKSTLQISKGENGAFALTWDDLGPGYDYTLEFNTSLNPDNWNPVPGVSWPITDNSIADVSPATFPTFYRVKIKRQ